MNTSGWQQRVEGNGAQGKALVVGAGVTGLTTAFSLRRRGFDVTVVAEKFAPDIVSVVAGALWEWPPAVCGHHQDARSLERSKAWTMASHDVFYQLARDEDTGVFIRPAVFYFHHPLEENPRELDKMNELASRVRGFRRDARLIEENGVSPSAGVVDAYTHLAPQIDTDAYMAWLTNRVVAAGCEIRRRRIDGNLFEQENSLLEEFGADFIVNCTGLGAAALTGDEMHPLRGALIRVHNDGHAMPKITTAHCVSHDVSSGIQDMVFILPRGRDMLLLGGLVEMDEWGLDIDLLNYGPVRDMLRRCVEFLPVLRNCEFDVHEPVRVGLRPYRQQNVRLERESGTRIIHNYGHGGSGFTFSWGCAEEVVELATQIVESAEDAPLAA